MVDALELRSIVAAAEQAAAAGDYAAAEQFLRQAARLQEAQLGPRHPDLANTLNNLGVVCEIAGKAAEAEACYRRAYATATSTLRPDDPIVITSGKNLRDFCEASGRPFELPAPPPKAAATVASPSPQSRGPIVGIAIAGGLVLAGFVAWSMYASRQPAGNQTERTTQAHVAQPPAPIPAATTLAPPPPIEKAPIDRRADADAAPRVEPSPAGGSVTLVEARLCRSLSTPGWECDEVTSPAVPGTLFFYTRIRATRDTRVQHRWYYEDRLLRTVALQVAANQGAGYRTYSRNTITAERAGTWRLELRTADGTLLHEERVLVR